ncbi:MAG: polysaccharide pyruvyl transferase family protein [Desulfobacteraceae bacterium]|nr:polysaccharide pyruvyl transferase family protein [Desulfobacteraceae bacterium]
MKNQFKIGILTFHKVDNYGAVLQAYALKKAIEKIDRRLKIEIIDYSPKFVDTSVPTFPGIDLLKPVISIFNFLRYLWRLFIYFRFSSIKKRKAFQAFRSNMMSISPQFYNLKNDIINYDIIITGSDQVWNTDITKGDSTYYLNCCPKAKKVSYAASFGHQNLVTIEKEYVKKYVSRIDCVSVRETSAVEEIKKILGKEVMHVLDPTLLITKDEWKKNICNKVLPIADSYLLIYSLELNQTLYKTAKVVAKKLNLKIVEIGLNGLRRPYQQADFIFNCVGPQGFINLFLNASFIVTNSFHGLAFSVNFKKNFYCAPHHTRAARMLSLLTILKLKDRLILNQNAKLNKENFSVDFTGVHEKLQQERDKSILFLSKALIHE